MPFSIQEIKWSDEVKHEEAIEVALAIVKEFDLPLVLEDISLRRTFVFQLIPYSLGQQVETFEIYKRLKHAYNFAKDESYIAFSPQGVIFIEKEVRCYVADWNMLLAGYSLQLALMPLEPCCREISVFGSYTKHDVSIFVDTGKSELTLPVVRDGVLVVSKEDFHRFYRDVERRIFYERL